MELSWPFSTERLSRTKLLVLLLFAAFVALLGPAEAFEVKGKAVSTSFCARGKCETSRCGDEVIYEVDVKNSVVIRKAILVSGKEAKSAGIGGLQSDNTAYTIVYADTALVTPDGKSEKKSEYLIKAIGKCGAMDSFETLVIGEDFIHTSRSSWDYFVMYYYNRIK